MIIKLLKKRDYKDLNGPFKDGLKPNTYVSNTVVTDALYVYFNFYRSYLVSLTQIFTTTKP